jgi:hypothetical protein
MTLKNDKAQRRLPYVAHILMKVVYVTPRPNETIPLWENIHLIRATGEAEAYSLAEAIGKESEINDGFFARTIRRFFSIAESAN